MKLIAEVFHCSQFDRNEILDDLKLPRMRSSKRKHLHIGVFHKNEDSGSKDQNKNEFHFISPAMKTYV